MAGRYLIAPGVSWRKLDDETVVYVESRFETHLLNWAAGAVLDCLDRPRGFDELWQAIVGSDEEDGVVAADEAAALQTLLQELLRLNVLTKTPC
jgi:hypothetical protein